MMRWAGGWLRFRLLVIAAVLAAVAAVALPVEGLEGFVPVVIAVVLLVLAPIFGAAIGRQLRRLQRRTEPLGEHLFGLLPGRALRTSGLRQIDVRVDPGRLRTMGRSIRDGDEAVIVLPTMFGRLPEPTLAGLLLHESAHLVRYDSDRQRYAWMAGYLFFVAAAMELGVIGVVAGLLVLFAAVIGNNWWSEYRCDAFVRDVGGAGPADGFATYLTDVHRSTARTVLARFTHPPDTWRAERLRGASGDHTAAQQHA